jgi:predicted Zn-dependent peptidase
VGDPPADVKARWILEQFEYTTETLGNGLRLTWLDLPHTHSVAVHVCVRTGPAYEKPANNGVSHLLEHLHMSVTRRHPTRRGLRTAFAHLSAERGAETRSDVLAFNFSTLPMFASDLMTLVGDLLEIRDFPSDIVDSERRLILDELRSITDYEPRFFRHLFGKHPFGLSRAGTPRSLRRLDAQELVEFGRASFAPDRIVVCVTGRLSSEILESARSRLSDLEPSSDWGQLAAPAPPDIRLPFFARQPPTRGQRQIVLGWVYDGQATHQHRVALAVLALGFSLPECPLSERLRYADANTYMFGCDLESLCGTRLFCLYGQTQRRGRDRFIASILDELGNIREGRSLDWLPDTINFYRHFVERCLDSPERLAARIALEEARAQEQPALTVRQELDCLTELTSENVVDAARTSLTFDKFFLVYHGIARVADNMRVKSMVKASFA